MLQVSLVGAAHIHTPGFVDRLKKRDDVKVKSVWDHDAERAAKTAEALGADVVAEADHAISDADLVGVIICSETNRHEVLVKRAAAAKKHVFAEKPLGVGAKDGYAMAEAIERAGVIFQTGYAMRSSPVNLFLKQQLDAGAFGEVTRVRCSTCHSGSLNGWFDAEWRWMADPAQAGVGGYGDLGTHSLDLMMWFLGDVERVAADIRVVTGRYGDCDETGEGLMRFASGATGVLAAGWVDVANPVSMEVCGTEGHATIVNGKLFFQSSKVEGADGKSPWEDLPEELPHAFELFLDAVVGKEGLPLVTAREAAARSAVMEALYKAARKGAWVEPETPA
ncbi:MAG: Gfo/Idh/MocA family protein [Planctomycetota bacterium]|jgi:predicted dehydrogenase